MQKMLFLFNPRSGKAQLKNHLLEIIDIFTKAGYEVTARPTQRNNDAYEYVKIHAPAFDRVVVSGGDGTLNEAVRGIMEIPEEHRKPIGYIPTGTTNDFASNLGIPKDMLEAARIAVNGNTRNVDIGTFNGRTFNYVAAFGAFTDISYETPQEIKNIFGQAAYLMEVVKKLSPIEKVFVSFNGGGIVRKGYYAVCLILNSSHVAGVKLNDYYPVDINVGEFEVALIEKPENLIKLSQSISAIVQGKSSGPGFEVIKASEITIETDRPVKWTLDGEFGGEVSKANIGVLKSAAVFIGK